MVLDKVSEIETRRLTTWLSDYYPNKKTRYTFETALKNWIKCLYGKDSVTNFRNSSNYMDIEALYKIEKRIIEIENGIDLYFSELDDRDFTDDFRTFLKWSRNERYAPLNIRLMSSRIKVFFAEQKPPCKISYNDWKVIKRTLLPRSTRPATQDDILTKEQLKILLPHLSIHAKSLALFLLSTGARIGESCKLKMSDINLDSDPPEVNIREEYTKGEVGGRVMWFSEEARDAIIEWHKERQFKNKPGRSSGPYDMNLVFNFKENVFLKLWNRALKRADGGRVPPVLARRDPSTKSRYHVYHIHTQRKFFRTNMGVKGSYEGKSGVPDMVVHAWMGHKAYLVTYDKLGLKLMSEIYKDNMNVVTINEVCLDEKVRAKYKETLERAEKLAYQNIEDRVFVDMVGVQLDIPEDLSMEEKKNRIIYRVAQMKVDAAHARERSIEEWEKALKHIGITEKIGKKG